MFLAIKWYLVVISNTSQTKIYIFFEVILLATRHVHQSCQVLHPLKPTTTDLIWTLLLLYFSPLYLLRGAFCSKLVFSSLTLSRNNHEFESQNPSSSKRQSSRWFIIFVELLGVKNKDLVIFRLRMTKWWK